MSDSDDKKDGPRAESVIEISDILLLIIRDIKYIYCVCFLGAIRGDIHVCFVWICLLS